jgi:hypothetical protein
MKMIMDERVYFTPGDTVILKQDIPHKPVMVVKTIDKAEITSTGKPTFLGVTCFWFASNGMYQSQRFNTKDLEHEPR